MPLLRFACLAIVVSVAACSGGGQLTGVGGTTGNTGVSGAAGAAGSSGACVGGAGCGGPTFVCPAIVPEANYACPPGSTALGCALPTNTTLVQSGNDVYVAARGALFRASASGLSPGVAIGAATDEITDWQVLIDEPDVYYFDRGPMDVLQLFRRRLDGSDAPTVSWGCAATAWSQFARIVPDVGALYAVTQMGAYRIEKAATAPAQALWGWGRVLPGAMAVDDRSLYVVSSYSDGISAVDKNSSCPCTCEAPTMSAFNTEAARTGNGLRCPNISGLGGAGGALGMAGGTSGGAGGAGGTTGLGGIGGALPSRPCEPSSAVVVEKPDTSSYFWLQIDGDALWFADSQTLYRARKDGSNLERILGPGSPNPSLMTGTTAMHAGYLYVVATSGSTHPLVRVDRSTLAVTTILADTPRYVSGIAPTSDAVYLLRSVPAAADPNRSCSRELVRYPL